MKQCKRKGNGYVELAVVIAVLLVINLFVIPRYQDLRRDAYRAQIANDSKLVEAYVLEYDLQHDNMPNKSIKVSDEDLKDLVDSKTSYLKGDILTSTNVGSIGGNKYLLDKVDILKNINTKLKGDFIYTDKGVIYIDNKVNSGSNSTSNNIPKEESPFIYNYKDMSIIGWDEDIGGEMPEKISVPHKIYKNGKVVVVKNVDYNFANNNLKQIIYEDGIERIEEIDGSGNNIEFISFGDDVQYVRKIKDIDNPVDLHLGKSIAFAYEDEEQRPEVGYMSLMRIDYENMEPNYRIMQMGRGQHGVAWGIDNTNLSRIVINNVTISDKNTRLSLKNGYIIQDDIVVVGQTKEVKNYIKNGNLKLPEGVKVLWTSSLFGPNNNCHEFNKDITRVDLPKSLVALDGYSTIIANTSVSELTFHENFKYFDVNAINSGRNIVNIYINSEEIHGMRINQSTAKTRLHIKTNPQNIYLSWKELEDSRVSLNGINLNESPYNKSMQYNKEANILFGLWNPGISNATVEIKKDGNVTLDSNSDNSIEKFSITKNTTIADESFASLSNYGKELIIELEKDDYVSEGSIFAKQSQLQKLYDKYGAGVYRKENGLWKFIYKL